MRRVSYSNMRHEITLRVQKKPREFHGILWWISANRVGKATLHQVT